MGKQDPRKGFFKTLRVRYACVADVSGAHLYNPNQLGNSNFEGYAREIESGQTPSSAMHEIIGVEGHDMVL